MVFSSSTDTRRPRSAMRSMLSLLTFPIASADIARSAAGPALPHAELEHREIGGLSRPLAVIITSVAVTPPRCGERQHPRRPRPAPHRSCTPPPSAPAAPRCSARRAGRRRARARSRRRAASASAELTTPLRGFAGRLRRACAAAALRRLAPAVRAPGVERFRGSGLRRRHRPHPLSPRPCICAA